MSQIAIVNFWEFSSFCFGSLEAIFSSRVNIKHYKACMPFGTHICSHNGKLTREHAAGPQDALEEYNRLAGAVAGEVARRPKDTSIRGKMKASVCVHAHLVCICMYVYVYGYVWVPRSGVLFLRERICVKCACMCVWAGYRATLGLFSGGNTSILFCVLL